MSQPSLAGTLDELLSYHDREFLVCAYSTVLGREPDPEGLRYYLNRLRSGVSKSQTVVQLALSDEREGVTKARLPGLSNLILRYRFSRIPVIGWFVKRHLMDEGGSLERKLRTIESQILLLNQEALQRLEHLEERIEMLHRDIALQQNQVSKQGTAPGSVAAAPAAPAFESLAPRAREIYFRLRRVAPGHNLESR